MADDLEDSESSNRDEEVVDGGPITEEEIQAFLSQNLVTTSDFYANFLPRLRTPQDKANFSATLKRIAMIHRFNGSTFVVLKEI